jgi:hypothetical protein
MSQTFLSYTKYFLIIYISVFLAACATEERYAEFVEQTVDGLQRVDNAGVDIAYVRPGIQFSDYDKVMIKSVEVRFRKDWAREHPRISAQDQERIKAGLTEIFHDIFHDELEEKGNIPIVNTPGPDVLSVSVQLNDLYINEVDNQRTFNTTVYVASAGSVTLVGELFDSVTDEILARVADHRVARSMGQFEISNRVTNTSEARQAFRHWADLLRESLNAVNEK